MKLKNASLKGRFFLNKIQIETLTNTNNKTNIGDKMSKMLKTIAILAVLIGNVSLFQSSANAWVNVDGYFKSNGTYVAPHIRTSPDAYTWNNLR